MTDQTPRTVADDWSEVKYSVREYIWYHANVTPQKAQDIADGIDRWYKRRAEAAQPTHQAYSIPGGVGDRPTPAASDWSRSNPLNLANRAVPEPAGAAERLVGPDPTSRTQSDFRHDVLGEPYPAGAAERLDVERLLGVIDRMIDAAVVPLYTEGDDEIVEEVRARLSEQAVGDSGDEENHNPSFDGVKA
jgi:hypothetical protein